MSDSDRMSTFESIRLALALQSIHSADDTQREVDRYAEKLTKLSAQALAVERVSIWVIHERALVCARLYLQSEDRFVSEDGVSAHAARAYTEVLATRRVLACDDSLTDRRVESLLETYIRPRQIGAMLDAPVFRNGEVVGVICHEHLGEPRQWTKRERDFASSLADMLGQFFERSEVLAQERRARASDSRAAEVGRLDALGRFATGIAHDFNQLLQLIDLQTASVMRTHELARLADVRATCVRGTRLVRQLMDYAKGGTSKMERINLRACLTDLRPLVEQLCHTPWSLKYELEEGEFWVDGSAPNIEQIVTNLVTNSLDAMPTGGPVTIRMARDEEPGERRVVLSVRDRGQGMPPEVQSRALEPFFTTKPPGQGTGLGLAIVLSTVQQMRGVVNIASEVGDGTEIAIGLPLLEQD
jgi:two-component system, cell cycle sensor histidine kinase and response regulator CckA